jgi:hypothetical protein
MINNQDNAELSPIVRAERLRKEAEHVLKLISLHEILRSYGKVFLSGSYFLDVMVYPDVDLYITKVSLKQLFEIGAQFAANELVTQVVFERSDDPIRLPEGLYLKTRVKYGNWGRPWKIDLWSLSEEVIMQRMAEMQHFLAKMTPEMRQQIVQYKLSILTPLLRTPVYSGYYIYKAFIDEGLADFKSVTNYLLSCGIQMETA